MQSHPDDTFSDKTKHITDPQDRGPQKMALVSKQEFCFGLTGNGWFQNFIIPDINTADGPVPDEPWPWRPLHGEGLLSRKPWEVEFDSNGESSHDIYA